MAIFMHTIDPSAVIIGGAMNFGGANHPLGKTFLERVRTSVNKIVLPICAQNTLIEFASLSGDAGYIGAAGMAREYHYKNDVKPASLS
jgi:glucokinase